MKRGSELPGIDKMKTGNLGFKRKGNVKHEALGKLLVHFGDTVGDMLCLNDQIQRFETQIEALRQMIERVDDLHLQSAGVSRLGLPYFRKDLLEQYQLYLEGLFLKIVVQKDDQALEKLYKAVKNSEMLCHDIGRKALGCMVEILIDRYEYQQTQGAS